MLDHELRQEVSKFGRLRLVRGRIVLNGLGSAQGGAAYYNFRIAEMTTLPLTAEEVHQTGLAEVARINAALAAARTEAGARKPVIYRDKPALTQAWYEIGARVVASSVRTSRAMWSATMPFQLRW